MLPMLIFMIISIIIILKNFSKFIKDKYYKYIVIVALILCFFLNYQFANCKDIRFLEKDNFFQYTFLKELEKVDNPTLVNMGGIDGGLYTTSGIIPTTYFFEQQNISYEKFPDNLDSFQEYIRTQKTDFILFLTSKTIKELEIEEKNLFIYYDLIASKPQFYKNKSHNAYLFKKKIGN